MALPSEMKRIPCATYRLQFNRDFTFQHASDILEYLGSLGISDVYASPLFQAGPQSAHGYDVCSFGKINPNLGAEGGFNRLTENIKDRGMGLLLDIVPNHMSATSSNALWLDVLEKGRESLHAGFFDIDWESKHPGLPNKVLLPVLEDRYHKVLEAGKLRLAHQDGKFSITYHERKFPVDARTLPAEAEREPSLVLTQYNGNAGQPRSFDRLDELIRRQHYRLAYWRVAPEEINYRRFFDVTGMVALKMELPQVFHETHELISQWLKSGAVTGLRIDHPDGLWDPKQYLQRLQTESHPSYVVVEKILSGDEPLPRDWPVEGTTGYDFLNRVNGLFVQSSDAHVFSEIYREFTGKETDFAAVAYRGRKNILERAFASELNALAGCLRYLAAHSRSGCDFTWSELHRALEEIIAAFSVYRSYVTENGHISAQDGATIRQAAAEARQRAGSQLDAAVFEFVERVLLLEVQDELDDAGTKRLRNFVMKFQQLTGPAVAKGLEDTAFYRFNRLISLNEVGGNPGKFGTALQEFHLVNRTMVRQWPHTMLASSTHDTKRGEDVRARINVLSEMPAEWRDAITRWSHFNADKKTKVGNAPAPDANDEYLLYQTLVGAWPFDAGSADGLKSFRTRISAFMLKAAKEAKTNTSWTEPNAAYEHALTNFVERALAEHGNSAFLEDLQRFANHVAFFGRINSLGQTLLKITSPGVPDFYQGGELWDLNLVDPDNRRPVDYSLRRALLSDLQEKFARNNIVNAVLDLLREDKSGASKLFLIWRALNFRKEHRNLFDFGEYVPLFANGAQHEHVCAFARIREKQAVIVIVPRLVFGLMSGAELQPVGGELWKQTSILLPDAFCERSWWNIFTQENVVPAQSAKGSTLELGKVLKLFPVALLSPAE